MKNRLLFRLMQSRGIATSVALFISSTTLSIAAAEPLFHLDFDEGFVATAEGRATPLSKKNRPGQVEGIDGSAAAFENGNALVYKSRENLNKAEGTISFWFKLKPIEQATKGVARTIFAEEASDKAGGTRIKIELYSDRFIRASIKDPRDSYVYYRDVAEWTPDEWHHVAVIWNVKKGALLYIDAQPVATSWMPAWKPKTYGKFVIGAANAKGAESANAFLDEFAIHDRELTQAELREAFEAFKSFETDIAVLDPFISAERKSELTLALENPGTRTTKLTDLRFSVIDEAGESVQSGTLPHESIQGTRIKKVEVPLSATPAGLYTFRLEYIEGGAEKSMESELMVMESREPVEARPAEIVLIREVDAVRQEPVAETGGTKVVESSIGSYREAGQKQHDRFAMDFTVEDVNKPHVAIIRYPDDKPRTMEVMLQDFGNNIDFQVHSGVLTGEEYPISNDMLEHRVVFWPRSERQAFIFMTAETGYPAAVSSIDIHRLNEFAVASHKGEFEGSVDARSVGLYYEDPVLFHSFGTGRDLEGFTKATDRLVKYMRSFGQTEFEYPLAWYAGPLYGTTVESFQPDIEGAQGGARPHPPGYPLYLLKRLGENGIKFTAGLQLHTLPSMNEYAITDWERIGNGEDTVINVNKDGELWHGHWHGSDPNYNAADPRVMEATNQIVEEVAQRYGQEPAFDGISIVITRPKLYSFGSISSGYNDSNLKRFQADSGIVIPPYDIKDADRFSKSYDWLMSQPEAKEAWIDWRCDVLFDHYAEMGRRLASVRADLKLKLTVFVHYTNNTRLADYMTEPSDAAMREMGIDPELYAGHPNIVLNYTVIPADLRWGRVRMDLENDGVNRTVFTAPEVVEAMRETEAPGLIIHDRYWEDAIGKEEPLEGLTELGVTEMVWRASTLNPARFHSLETYVHALNNMEVSTILKGGYVVGTFGIEDELARFAQAFQALPAVSFDDVPEASDPVRIRQKVVDGELYFYVLNTLPEPLETVVKLAKQSDVLEPVTGETFEQVDHLSLSLEPYGLRTFRSPLQSQKVLSAEATVSEAWLSALEERYRGVLRTAEASGELNGKYKPYLDLARSSWSQGHYSRLYFLMQEHWVSEVTR